MGNGLIIDLAFAEKEIRELKVDYRIAIKELLAVTENRNNLDKSLDEARAKISKRNMQIKDLKAELKLAKGIIELENLQAKR